MPSLGGSFPQPSSLQSMGSVGSAFFLSSPQTSAYDLLLARREQADMKASHGNFARPLTTGRR